MSGDTSVRSHQPTADDGLPRVKGGIWGRQLSHYPDTGPRAFYLAITVLATIVLYYELYVGGAVATQIIADFGMSFTYFVYRLGRRQRGRRASPRSFAGLADRWGRANLVVGGAADHRPAHRLRPAERDSKTVYLVLFALLSFVEGIVLVATPALIRDFSPQLGRASAMGFWTLGPGARQPGRHRGLQPHPRQPPGLAVPVLRLRHRRPRRLRDRALRPAGALAAGCATS